MVNYGAYYGVVSFTTDVNEAALFDWGYSVLFHASNLHYPKARTPYRLKSEGPEYNFGMGNPHWVNHFFNTGERFLNQLCYLLESPEYNDASWWLLTEAADNIEQWQQLLLENPGQVQTVVQKIILFSERRFNDDDNSKDFHPYQEAFESLLPFLNDYSELAELLVGYTLFDFWPKYLVLWFDAAPEQCVDFCQRVKSTIEMDAIRKDIEGFWEKHH